MERISFNAFMALDDGAITLQACVQEHGDHSRIRLYGRSETAKEWTEHATVDTAHRAADGRPSARDAESIRQGMSEADPQELYDRLRETGLDYGPVFRGMRRLWHGDDAAVAEIAVDDVLVDVAACALHPAVLDACFHTAAALPNALGALLLPVSVERIIVSDPLPSHVTAYARHRSSPHGEELLLDLDILAENGEVLLAVEGLALRAVPSEALPRPRRTTPRQYETTWVPLAPPGENSYLAGRQGTWLVCGTQNGLVQTWTRRLDEIGLTGVGAVLADSGAVSSDLLSVDPTSEEALLRLAAEVRAEAGPLRGIVMHAGMPAVASSSTVPVTYDIARKCLGLLRGLLKEFAADVPELLLCSVGALSVHGEAPALSQTPVTALARAVVTEYPELACQHIDLDPGGEAPSLDEVLARSAALGGSGHLALRDGVWHEARLRERAGHRTDQRVPVRADASYIVTGGLGGLGLAISTWLADQGARHLLLVGRTRPSHEPAELTALRSRGVQVEFRAIDVADPKAVRQLLTEAGEHMPPVRGVVHAAGVRDDGPLEQLDWRRFSTVLDAKVRGAWNLHEALASHDQDLFILFSSLASAIGSPGQANYITANAFLDGLARLRQWQGLPALSVNWGPWSESGMAADPALLGTLAAKGISGLSTHPALAALETLAADRATCAVVADVDWPRYSAASGGPRPYTLLADLVPEPRHAPPHLPDTPAEQLEQRQSASIDPSDPAALRAAVTDELLERLGDLLGLNSTERAERRPTFADLRLNELGLDSLLAVRLRNRLRIDYATDVPPHLLFGGNTVSDVVGLICRQLTLRSIVAEPDADAPQAQDIEVITL